MLSVYTDAFDLSTKSREPNNYKLESREREHNLRLVAHLTVHYKNFQLKKTTLPFFNNRKFGRKPPKETLLTVFPFSIG